MWRPLKDFQAGLALVLVALLGAPGVSVQADNAIAGIQVSSRLDLNAILITEVDVAFVYDEALAAALPDTKGGWYAQKYDLLEETDSRLDLVTVSAPQGFVFENLVMPDRSGQAVRVFAAAYHEASGVRLHEITGMQRVLIEIDQFGILVSERN